MEAAYIVAGKRTPIGAFNGALATVPAPKLAATALKAALEQAGLEPQVVEELYVGNVLSANMGQAPATQVAVHAGLPASVVCTLINKVCASGTKAVMLAAQSIMLGERQIVAACGMENMSLVPHYVPHYRTGYKYGNVELLDGIVRDGLQDVYSGMMMGMAGELCAEKYGIGRKEQDDYAVRAYRSAAAAYERGYFADEIVPVVVEGKKGAATVDKDEEPANVRYDKIPELRPAFKKDGTITAANASKINDGAAALILASETAVKKYNLRPTARVAGFADAAREPEWFTVAPADAVPAAAKKAGLSLGQIDVFEINEAFSVVALVNQKLMDIPDEKLNPNGGAVSLGHPIGCSGARLALTLARGLKEKNARYGAVGICNGGGGASALVLEAV
ncbi:MAG: acetyl-CoA C-acyltransferase [Bacteroidia bacterium]|nr:acetyl-CoA C-acyltransferase [Bacteroidia bacterium]